MISNVTGLTNDHAGAWNSATSSGGARAAVQQSQVLSRPDHGE